MKKQFVLLLAGLAISFSFVTAQNENGNPFKHLGYEVGVYTLTDYNEEFHDFEDVVEIGQVLYDTRNKKIVGFAQEKGHRIELVKDVISTSIDPHCEKYPWISPYAYCFNNPVNFIDPDGKDGIFINFPDYKVDTETFLGKQPLGHSGVLLIDNKTGLTKYYEYGRYATSDGTKGMVRNVTVSDVKIGEDGRPTPESLNKVMGEISKNSGQGGKIEGAYVPSDDFKGMNDYAQSKLNESNVGKPGYDKDRQPYSLTGNNCATFAADVLKQDANVNSKVSGTLVNTPGSISSSFRSSYDKVDYHNGSTTITPTKSFTEKIKGLFGF